MSEEKKRVRVAGNEHEPGKDSTRIIRHSDESGKSNAAQRAVESLSRRLKGEQGELTKPKGEEFKPGGPFYALGVAVQQIGSEVDPAQVRALWESVKAQFRNDDDDALELLREVESFGADLPPEFGGPEELEEYPTLVDADQILGETSYQWTPYIMDGGLNAIAGDVSAGKTLFAMDLHRRQWHGLVWPDGSRIPESGRRAIWLMADQRLGQLTEAARNMGVPFDSIVLAAEKDKATFPLSLDDGSHIDRLNRIVKGVQPWAVFIDTFTSAMGTKEHNKPEIMNPITTRLLDIAQAYRIPMVLLCHTNAEGGIYGKALARKCEHQLSIVLSDRNDSDSPRNVHCKRSRRKEDTRSMGVQFSKTGLSYCEPHKEVDDSVRHSARGSKTESDSAAVSLVLDKAGKAGAVLKDMADALAGDDRSDSAAIKAAQRAVEKLLESGAAAKAGIRYYKAGNQPHDVSSGSTSQTV